VHIYPAWTRASYNFETLAALARLQWVKCMKVGTRDMNKYARDLHVIKQANPNVTVLTCHDEYLLPSMMARSSDLVPSFRK
jgi:4-hydroxy-tetrahydrodipicolinate synthase